MKIQTSILLTALIGGLQEITGQQHLFPPQAMAILSALLTTAQLYVTLTAHISGTDGSSIIKLNLPPGPATAVPTTAFTGVSVPKA